MALRGRAATPATVFLLVAFVLLLVSVLSVPITKTIALGSYNGVSFGVFGYCVQGTCSSIQLGYDPDRAFQNSSGYPGPPGPPPSKRFFRLAETIVTDHLSRRQSNNPGDFTLPPSARNGLSNILIVHVIADALTLVALILCIIAHVRRPSHSVRFLLAIFVIGILTTILTLLAFLVDLLAFVPHLAFGTWLVLAATICNAIATILLCCGRRTLIGRKAMRRRIEENPEMSGQNYFKQEAAKDYAIAASTDAGKIPQYAEFEVNKPAPPLPTNRRIPLNASETHLMAPVDRNASSDRSELAPSEDTLPGAYTRKGPSPYESAAGYPLPPSAARPPPNNRPYERIPPVRLPMDRPYTADGPRAYPGSDRPAGGLPSQRSNASLNSMTRPPRSAYDVPVAPPPGVIGEQRHASSVYSDYVPPRRNWGGQLSSSRSMDEGFSGDTRGALRPERPKIDTYNLDRPYDERRQNRSPYESRQQYATMPTNPSPDASRNRRTSDTGTMIASYYEDVDPRFDDTPPEEEIQHPYVAPAPIPRNLSSNSLDAQPEGGAGPRSPAASTSSHFTSVSQRGINPRWQPPPPQPQFEQHPRRQRPRNDQMQFLTGNPDFELPVSRSGNKRTGGGGGAAGSLGAISPLDGGGRYPVPR